MVFNGSKKNLSITSKKTFWINTSNFPSSPIYLEVESFVFWLIETSSRPLQWAPLMTTDKGRDLLGFSLCRGSIFVEKIMNATLRFKGFACAKGNQNHVQAKNPFCSEPSASHPEKHFQQWQSFSIRLCCYIIFSMVYGLRSLDLFSFPHLHIRDNSAHVFIVS